MLDQQFFNNPQFKSFLTKNFVLLHADSQVEEGRELFNKYDVHSTPQILIFGADFQEVDRLTGYGSNEQFKGELDRVLRGENTILNLALRIEENPDDLPALAELAKKYNEAYARKTARGYSSRILEKNDMAANILWSFGEDDTKISVLEYAYFMECYGEWENTKYFLEKYASSPLFDDAVGILGWQLRKSDENEDILAYFQELKKDHPENKMILLSMVNYYNSIDELDKEGIRCAQKLLAAHMKDLGQDDLEDCATLFLKHNKINEAIAAYGFLYAAKLIEKKDANALNGYAWFWALKEENLKDALKAAKKAVEFAPEDDNIWDTLSMVYWKNGDHQKAIETEEHALKLAGGDVDSYKKRISAIKADMSN